MSTTSRPYPPHLNQPGGELNMQDPNDDDFELWGPSIEREEVCLFGRRVSFHVNVNETTVDQEKDPISPSRPFGQLHCWRHQGCRQFGKKLYLH